MAEAAVYVTTSWDNGGSTVGVIAVGILVSATSLASTVVRWITFDRLVFTKIVQQFQFPPIPGVRADDGYPDSA
jgi:hypothetical protein